MKTHEWFSRTASSLFDSLKTSCCTLSLIQDFHSHFGTINRIVTCWIGSLLHRHKNCQKTLLLFERLFQGWALMVMSLMVLKVERTLVIHSSHWQFLPDPRFKPTTLAYKSDALSIRPQLLHIKYFFYSLLLSLIYSHNNSHKITQKWPSWRVSRFFLSTLNVISWERKRECIGYWIRALCLVRAEQFKCHVFCALRFFISNRCAASVVIIEEFSYMHTIGQHKRLSLVHEEGDLTKLGAGVLTFCATHSDCATSH